MESNELPDKVINNIMESIAILNVKREIESKKLRNQEIFYALLSTCTLFVLTIFIGLNTFKDKKKLALIENTIQNEINVNYLNEISNMEENNDYENKDNLSIIKILANADKNKVKYIKSEFSFEYEPTIENLYKNADVVIIGTFDSNLKTYVDGVNIHTQTKFNTSKVLKNETKLEVKENVTFDRIGGIMTLSDYMKNNNTIRKDEFTDISEKARNDYYVVQEFAPDNKLDFASSNDQNNYIIFLSYSDEVLMLNSSYYGMRRINEINQIYDYDTKKYINCELIAK